MKPVGCFSKLVALGVALAAVSAVSSVQAATGRAVVRVVQGTASYADQGGEWKPLTTGQSLSPGASVKTGVDGRVVLFLGDNGPDVSLYDSTTVGLDRLNLEGAGAEGVVETQLSLTAGTIQGVVRKLSAASKYEVKTPNAVVGVKVTGTKYQISANGVVHVMDMGSMVVVYINPVTQQMSTHTVGPTQTFVPPVNPGAPGAAAIVRPTRPDEILGPIVPTPEHLPTLIVVPSPEPYVSPIHKSANSSSSTTTTATGD